MCLFSEHISLDQMVTEWCPDPLWDTNGQYQCLLGSYDQGEPISGQDGF